MKFNSPDSIIERSVYRTRSKMDAQINASVVGSIGSSFHEINIYEKFMCLDFLIIYEEIEAELLRNLN